MSQVMVQNISSCTDKLVGISCILSKKDGKNFDNIFYCYEELIIPNAFDFTLKSLNELENSKERIIDNFSILAISQWFLALEYFVTNLAKISFWEQHELTEENLKKLKSEYKKKNVYQKVNAICENFNVEKTLFLKSELAKRINSFYDYRNALFHAGTFEGDYFCQTPTLTTQEEVLLAMDIFISTARMFRGILFELDIMPTIPLMHNNSTKFFHVDIIYEDLIVPLYKKILTKHNLSENFKPLCNTFSYTRDANNYMYDTKIKAIPSIGQESQLNIEDTQFTYFQFQNFLKKNFEGLKSNMTYLIDAHKHKNVSPMHYEIIDKKIISTPL